MTDKEQLEDSPFYVNYSGTLTQTNVKLPKDMIEALKKHYHDKYADDIQKDKFRFGKYIRHTLEDYMQHQAIARISSKYSIFGIVQFNKVENNEMFYEALDFIPLFIKKESEYYSNSDNVSLLMYNCHQITYKMYESMKKHFTKKEQEEIETYFKTKTTSGKLVLIEIPLNNYLDIMANGVYSYKEDESDMHHGIVTLSTLNGACGIHYIWKYTKDCFNLLQLGFVGQKETLELLKDCQNYEVQEQFNYFFHMCNVHFPMYELDLLKHDLNNKKNDLEDLKSEIDSLQEKIAELEQK